MLSHGSIEGDDVAGAFVRVAATPQRVRDVLFKAGIACHVFEATAGMIPPDQPR